MKQPYILCAAIWIKDGKEHPHQPKNIKSGLVVCGRRHHNCFFTASELAKQTIDKYYREDLNVIQGFVTSDDRFVDRQEAWKIALYAQQVQDLHGGKYPTLFSEDLY